MTNCGSRTIRRTAVALTVAICLVSCARSQKPPEDSDVVVATVDGAPVTLKDLKGEIARIRGVSPALPARTGTRAEVSRALRQLIERSVVVREGERLGVRVSGSDVEEEVRRYRADFPPGGLEKALLQEGIDVEEWREELRMSILYRKSAAAVARPQSGVTDAEVEKVFRERFGKQSRPERIRVRQLLFDSPEAASRAREKLAEGASPEDVAKRFSSGETGALDADLGYLSREELPEEVAQELFALPAGGVSRAVRRDKSYSLFLVVEKSPAGAVSYDEKAPEIRRELEGRRREEAFREWLGAEVAKAEVKVQESIVSQLAEGGK